MIHFRYNKLMNQLGAIYEKFVQDNSGKLLSFYEWRVNDTEINPNAKWKLLDIILFASNQV